MQQRDQPGTPQSHTLTDVKNHGQFLPAARVLGMAGALGAGFLAGFGCEGSGGDTDVSEQSNLAALAACHLNDGSVEKGAHLHACEPDDHHRPPSVTFRPATPPMRTRCASATRRFPPTWKTTAITWAPASRNSLVRRPAPPAEAVVVAAVTRRCRLRQARRAAAVRPARAEPAARAQSSSVSDLYSAAAGACGWSLSGVGMIAAPIGSSS